MSSRLADFALIAALATFIALAGVVLWHGATGTPDLSAVFDTTPSV